MDNFVCTKWVYEIHSKIEVMHHRFQEICPKCAFYHNGKNYSHEKSRNFYWGLCSEHLDTFSSLLREAEELHFELERELGILEEGYMRHLPDGRLCSMRSVVWRDHLLSLASK